MSVLVIYLEKEEKMMLKSEASKGLEAGKKNRIIEQYLRDRYKADFNPAWLTNMDNYANLAAAIDFFYQLQNDNLNMVAIGSDNLETRTRHEEQFRVLVHLLDNLVTLTKADPPVASEFREKDAILAALKLNQGLESRSLRDLHAQSANLGVAEKLLNSDLGQTEWLGEVDLERMLIKLGVRDRTHITRLNAEDIGMVLHFERVKHADSTDPYTIPLLINCGSSGSLRSQGSHWTYAMVTVNPATNAVTIDYQDSMPLNGTEQATLMSAINYTDGPYSAFPGYTTKNANTATDGLQTDGWSCGYRALKGLLSAPGFPSGEDITSGVDWQRVANTPVDSYALRNVMYELLLSGLEIDPDYFVAMQLDSELVQESSTKGKSYELDSAFMHRYLNLLTGSGKTERPITTDHFTEAYETILAKLPDLKTVNTDRKKSVDRLEKDMAAITCNEKLSADAKIVALLEVLASEYAQILGSFGGANSELGKAIKSLCANHFGVDLGKDPLYRLKSGGLMLNILNDQAGMKTEKAEIDTLLPPVKRTVEMHGISVSEPTLRPTVKTEPRLPPSVDQIEPRERVVDEPALRQNKEHSRLGSMFGSTQFCYAEKPGGVEPGFRAIDTDELFFQELDKILAEKNLPSGSEMPPDLRLNLSQLREALQKAGGVNQKQRAFATFINTQVKGPHAKGDINPGIQWVCDQVKKAVTHNNRLSAWMYKLDYAEGQKERIKANKEAIREFVGTRLAGIFSEQNQKQEIAWVNNGKKGVHALLACGWKNGLQELTQFLHNGSEPDYNGILVEDKNAKVKFSKHIPGLGRNLIFGIAIGDRDGMGKDGQNKGFADGAFYGFDYGKPYEGAGICASLRDDFSFEDSYAKAPSVFRGSSAIGFARHFMYRNYSVFYDTPLSERMAGFHLLRKMITGENPDEEVIKSYPGLRQELFRIQENTPSAHQLLTQLAGIRVHCKEGTPMQALVDAQVMQLCSGKLSTFDFYFAKMKIDLIEMAVNNDMPDDELKSYIEFIDEMQLNAQKSNSHILAAFDARRMLTRQETDLLQHLELYFSPSAALSPDGKVFLNMLRFDPQSGRIPFQLKREENGTYTLSTPNIEIARQLKAELGFDFTKGAKELSINITQDQVAQLMRTVEEKYQQKRDNLLLKPTYESLTLPRLLSLFNTATKSGEPKIGLGYMWREDKSLSLQIIAQTEQQAQQAKSIFGIKPVVGEAILIEIPKTEHKHYQNRINGLYEENQITMQIRVEPPRQPGRWAQVHKRSAQDSTASASKAEQLMNRLTALISDEALLKQLDNAVKELSRPGDLEQLMQYNDQTLSSPENIKAIIEERLDAVKVIKEELLVTGVTSPVDVHQNTL